MKQIHRPVANNVIVGHGSIGAGVDWQKQTTTPGTGYVEDGYDQRNTGIYLTGLQQVGDLPLKAQHAVTITHSLVVMEPGKPAPVGNSSKVIASLLPTGHLKAPNLGQLYGFYGNPNLDPRKANSGKARLKA